MTDPARTHHDNAVVERFPPTNGRVTAALGLITAGVVLVVAVLDWDAGAPLGVAIVATLAGVLVWVALLRPAVWTTKDDLVMRAMLHTDRIPLAAIDQVVVTQMLAVGAGGKRYLSPVIGYTARQSVKGRIGGSTVKIENSHQHLVETRIAHLAQEARDLSGIRNGSPEQQALAAGVRRSWAWPEITVCGLLVLAFVVWLVL